MRLSIYLTLIVFIFSCESNSVPILFDFFPIKQSRVYEVAEIDFKIDQTNTKKNYFLKENYNTIKPNDLIQVERFTSVKKDSEWKLKETFFLKIVQNENILSKDGVDFLYLVTPLTENSQWNINTYNNTKTQLTLPTKIFKENNDYFAKVTYFKDSSLVSNREESIVFKNGVGPVNIIEKDLVYCQETPNCIGKGIIKFGFQRNYKLIE